MPGVKTQKASEGGGSGVKLAVVVVLVLAAIGLSVWQLWPKPYGPVDGIAPTISDPADQRGSVRMAPGAVPVADE